MCFGRQVVRDAAQRRPARASGRTPWQIAATGRSSAQKSRIRSCRSVGAEVLAHARARGRPGSSSASYDRSIASQRDRAGIGRGGHQLAVERDRLAARRRAGRRARREQPRVGGGDRAGLGREHDLVAGVGQQPPGHRDLGDVEVVVRQRDEDPAQRRAAGSIGSGSATTTGVGVAVGVRRAPVRVGVGVGLGRGLGVAARVVRAGGAGAGGEGVGAAVDVDAVPTLICLQQVLRVGAGDPDAAVRGRVGRDAVGAVDGPALVEVLRVVERAEVGLALADDAAGDRVVADGRQRGRACGRSSSGTSCRCRS